MSINNNDKERSGISPCSAELSHKSRQSIHQMLDSRRKMNVLLLNRTINGDNDVVVYSMMRKRKTDESKHDEDTHPYHCERHKGGNKKKGRRNEESIPDTSGSSSSRSDGLDSNKVSPMRRTLYSDAQAEADYEEAMQWAVDAMHSDSRHTSHIKTHYQPRHVQDHTLHNPPDHVSSMRIADVGDNTVTSAARALVTESTQTPPATNTRWTASIAQRELADDDLMMLGVDAGRFHSSKKAIRIPRPVEDVVHAYLRNTNTDTTKNTNSSASATREAGVDNNANAIEYSMPLSAFTEVPTPTPVYVPPTLPTASNAHADVANPDSAAPNTPIMTIVDDLDQKLHRTNTLNIQHDRKMVERRVKRDKERALKEEIEENGWQGGNNSNDNPFRTLDTTGDGEQQTTPHAIGINNNDATHATPSMSSTDHVDVVNAAMDSSAEQIVEDAEKERGFALVCIKTDKDSNHQGQAGGVRYVGLNEADIIAKKHRYAKLSHETHTTVSKPGDNNVSSINKGNTPTPPASSAPRKHKPSRKHKNRGPDVDKVNGAGGVAWTDEKREEDEKDCDTSHQPQDSQRKNTTSTGKPREVETERQRRYKLDIEKQREREERVETADDLP